MSSFEMGLRNLRSLRRGVGLGVGIIGLLFNSYGLIGWLEAGTGLRTNRGGELLLSLTIALLGSLCNTDEIPLLDVSMPILFCLLAFPLL